MSISSIGGNVYIPKASNGQNLPGSSNTSGATSSVIDSAISTSGPGSTLTTAESQFMDYMKKTPQERLEEDWLKRHGLTKEKLAQMSPAERQAVMDQMKKEIEEQMKNAAAGKTDILV